MVNTSAPKNDAGGALRWRKHDPEKLKSDFGGYLVDELDRSPNTAKNYLNSLRCLERFSSKSVVEIGPDELRAFKRSEYAAASKQAVVVAMHQFHRWGALEGHWERNGIMDVLTPRTPLVPKPPLSLRAARTLLASCRLPNQYRVVYLGLYAGLRISESASITREEWRHDRLVFIGKGRKRRSVPVHPELHKWKNKILQETPSSAGVLQSTLSRLRAEVGVFDPDGNPARSHALRRTFGTTLYEQGTPWEVIAKLLGHGKDVTALYARIPWDRMVGCLLDLDYFQGDPVQLSLF